MPLSRNADYGNYLYTCNRCRSCAVEPSPEHLSVCPSYAFGGFFAYSGGGKGYVAQGLLEGKVAPSPEVLQLAMTCLLCNACARACPPGFDTTAFIRDLRDHLVSAGLYLSPAHRALLENMRRVGNPFGQALTGPEAPALTGEEEILVFRGCLERKTGELSADLEKVLEAADVIFGVLEDEPCCGAPLLDLGDKKSFAKASRKLVKKLAASGAKRVLTLCPHCASTLTALSLEHDDFDLDLVSLPAFLAELLTEERLKPSREIPLTVTYHDPCHLARDLEEFEPPREALAALTGIELVEMPRHGEWGWCCGAAGGMAMLMPELAEFTREERLREARATSAAAIATGCSHCSGFLAPHSGKKLPVVHLLKLVAERI